MAAEGSAMHADIRKGVMRYKDRWNNPIKDNLIQHFADEVKG